MNKEDLQRLGRVFNAGCDLRTSQDTRINEWLGNLLGLSSTGCTCWTGGAIQKDPDCPLGDH